MKSILRTLIIVCTLIVVYIGVFKFARAEDEKPAFDVKNIVPKETFVVSPPDYHNFDDYVACWQARMDPIPPPPPPAQVTTTEPVAPAPPTEEDWAKKAQEFINSHVNVKNVMLCSNPTDSLAWLQIVPWKDRDNPPRVVQQWTPRVVGPGDYVWIPNEARGENHPNIGLVTQILVDQVIIEIKFPAPDSEQSFETKREVQQFTSPTPAASQTTVQAPSQRNSNLPPAEDWIPADWGGRETVKLNDDGSSWLIGLDDFEDINSNQDKYLSEIQFDTYINPTTRQAEGIVAEDIPEESPAREYGFRSRDVIKSINGRPVSSMAHARDIVRQLSDSGTQDWVVEIIRNNRVITKQFRFRNSRSQQ
ncbi:MAG: PDZ domain-containing protein [Planctomycetes bacterium]|nr:PDZ domain-containing protein [Planctomycetota bacterium]